MSVSTKELFTAFFKGLAFAKGLNFGEKNRGMAEDRWITIHPWGMSQGEGDTGEGKGYYRRIEINDETGEIEKGLGAGTNIKDLSKTLKAKKNGEETEKTSKTDNETTSKEPKAAEPEKKTKEPEEKTVETTEQPKKNFKDRIKDIAYQDFKMTNTDWWYEPKYVEQQLNKLDPEDPVTEKALKSVEEAIKTGDTRLIKSRIDGISHYANDKEKYLRSFKATKDSFKRTVKLYDNILEKLKKVDTAPIREELKTKAKALWDKHGLDIQDVDKAIKGYEERNGGLSGLSKATKMDDKYYEVLGAIKGSRAEIVRDLKQYEDLDPTQDPLRWFVFTKEHITTAKRDAKDYLSKKGMAMDSAEYLEIMELLNQIDFNDGIAQDSALKNLNSLNNG